MAHVTKMDQDRRSEVTDAIVRWLEGHGLLDRYGPIEDVEDWTALHRHLADDGHPTVAAGIGERLERWLTKEP